MQLALLAPTPEIGRRFLNLDAAGREIHLEKSLGRGGKSGLSGHTANVRLVFRLAREYTSTP